MGKRKKKSIVIKNEEKKKSDGKNRQKKGYDEEMDGSKSKTGRISLHQLKNSLIGVYGTTKSCKLCRFQDAEIIKVQQRICLRQRGICLQRAQ